MDSDSDDVQKSAQCVTPGASLDAARFAEMFELAEPRIYGFVLNRVRHRETAHDLTQETFTKAWSSRTTFDPEQDDLAWLIAIATNVIVDHVKHVQAKKRDPQAGGKVPRGDGRFATGPNCDAATHEVVDPIAKLIDAERIEAMNAAIDRLDPPKRQAIEFRQAGLSYDEIAVRICVKPGTVGSLVSRAVKDLKEMLAAHIERH